MLTASMSRDGGGVSGAVQALSRHLAGGGVEVQVFAARDAHSEADLAGWGEVPVSLQSQIGPVAFGLQKGLHRALAMTAPELIHLHGLWMYPSLAALAAGRTGTPRIVSPHGMLDPWAMRNAGWKKRLAYALFEGRDLNGARLLHALNDSERAAIRSLGIRGPVAVIPNGVVLPDPDRRPAPPDWMRQDGRKILLFLGRLHPKKGLFETIQAWHLTQQAQPEIGNDWLFAIAGWDDGGHRAALEDRVAALGLGSSVRFLGPVFGAEKDALLVHAHAFILASHSEGLPMAVLEAWSHGRPVLMSAECNLPEGFAAGAAIRLSTAPEALAHALGDALTLPAADLADIGARGRSLVAARYGWPRIEAEMRQAYAWALGGGAPPVFVETEGN